MDLNKLMNNLKSRKIRKDQILILFLAGILLLVITIPAGEKETDEDIAIYEEIPSFSVQDSSEYTQYLEQKLENILSKMEGVGEAAVMITLSSSAEQVIEKDMEVTDEVIAESDSQGGTRTTNQSSRSETTIYDGEEGSSPYVSKEISPKVEGVIVIADGGNNAVVVKNITESIQALFGIESHKIRIVKKGG